MSIFASVKWTSLWLILIACICVLPTSGFAEKQEPSYRTAVYFENKYSAYAYAQVSGGQMTCDVYLQFLPGFSPEAAIEGYAIHMDGEALKTEMKPVPNTADGGMSTYFTATEKGKDGVKKIVLIPQTASGELAGEAIVLYDAATTTGTVAETAVVNNPVATDKLNLRIAPDGDADSLRQYYNGVQVEVLNTMPGGWVAVSIGQSGGIARGYMKADYLAFGKDGDAVEPAMPSHEANVDSWTLYSYADGDSVPVAEYGKGQVFIVLARSSTWWHIAVGDLTGFVRADVLVEEEAPVEEATPALTAPSTTQTPQETMSVDNVPETSGSPSATPQNDS